MLLSVIIVNFNTRDLLKACLMHLYKALDNTSIQEQYEVIVIDNNSTDKSVEMVYRHYPKVKVIPNDSNIGFSRANNIGIKRAKGRYILLLNSDTEIDLQAIYFAISAIQENEKIGVIGGKLLNTDGSLQSSFGFFPDLRRVLLWMLFLDDIPLLSRFIPAYHISNLYWHTFPRFVDWVSGAFFLFQKNLVNVIGYMDETIFMYGEEVELCYRIKNKGYKVLYDPKVRIKHHKGASGFGETAGILEEYKFIKYFYYRYKPKWQQDILSTLLKFGALLRFILFGIMGQKTRKILYAKAFNMA